ncbi:N utilization substance protein B [Longispora fulva]|uniref:Transcription antitermination protein NusB n=1 Tax=Longispora fulva TaxID=619741 RepID=A0A8J7GR28_9ACTN|nr:transcription antitermination factor NusB [Longispora fulva]MBG6141818.1 N utilization substance protein B [Longispora fulva]GIG59027.1 N utilization substance protein B [Longispora fulva]
MPESSHDPAYNPARRKARRRALDVLYEADIRQIGMLGVLTARQKISLREPEAPKFSEYAVTLVEGVAQRREEIDELISTYAEGWTLERMPTVDRNLLRIAVFELMWGDGIDAPVAISEAVELAKELSTDDSPRFINGVLGRISDYSGRW